MGTIHVRDGDLFADSTPGACLVHSCNARGVWGSGVAQEFKLRYPQAYVEYKNFCEAHKPVLVMGRAVLLNKHTNRPIGCLLVSKDYGVNRDATADILAHTERAIKDLLGQLREYNGPTRKVVVFSPQINAGLFAVPWHETLSLIKRLVEPEPDLQWTVFTARVIGGRS